MSWARKAFAPSPHLLDPALTVVASRTYFGRWFSRAQLAQHVADQMRAIEHEQAVLEGLRLAYTDAGVGGREKRGDA